MTTFFAIARLLRAAYKALRAAVGILLVTFALTVFADLVIAVNVGVVLAALLFMRRMAHAVQVHGADAGDYQLDFEVYRPGGQTPGPVQRIFLDFNGQRANTGIWGGSGVRDLSPLSSFLSSWGLTKADEPALIRKITAEVTENVKAGGKLGGNTQLHYHRFLSSVFEKAVKWQLIDENPCRRTEAPKAAEIEVEALQEEDVAKLLEALQDAPAQYSVITQLALLTGARRGEICALRWSDIDLDAGVISINRTVQNIAGRGTVFTAPKTKRSRRCIKIGPECVQLLREYRQHQKAERFKVGSEWMRRVEIENGKTVDNDLLFTRWNGQPLDPNAVTSWFPGFLAAHDLPAVHFHSLRHTNASLLIAAHVPVTTVSGRLGHAKTSTTTDIYAGFIRSSDAAAADALTDVFSRIKEKSHA